MQRYFFDFIHEGKSDYDYSGRFLSTPREAQELAELIAFDLAVTSDERKRNEWLITVQDEQGRRIFSVPVQSSCLAAA
jgi:hypothetical protein